MKKNALRWKIGGAAGYGIMAAGLVFGKTCMRGGLQVFDYTEYPSLIRGGHNTYHIRVDDHDVSAHDDRVDLLVALNTDTLLLHRDELEPGAGIIYDSAVVTMPLDEYKIKGFRLFPVPLTTIAKEKGDLVMQNTVAIGASFALVKYPFHILEQVILDTFSGKKNEAVARMNVVSAKAGYDFIESTYASNDFPFHLEPTAENPDRVLITGNEAIALGAIAAGCKFYVAYPMSPSSSILHTMAAYAEKFGIVVKHAEDEIGVVNMAIGASWAGVRSMLATSGGGFSLMVESLGLAGITETPLVMINAQRPGPATGLPTWSEQADLRFTIHAAQGEFPRFVLTPGDVEECFFAAGQAFNLAEKYQTPVIILLDKYLSECHTSVAPFDTSRITIDRGEILTERDLNGKKEFKRYAVTDSGISPRVFPGTLGGVHLANNDEHDEFGYSDESSENRTTQVEKRFRKLAGVADKLPQPRLYGDEHADVTLVGWGSTKGPIREAMHMLEGSGITVNHLHLMHVYPLPTKAISRVLDAAKKTIIVENNATGQLFGLIREWTGKEADAKMLKFDGRPFHPREIAESVKKILTNA